jgi:hypothetical protein
MKKLNESKGVHFILPRVTLKSLRTTFRLPELARENWAGACGSTDTAARAPGSNEAAALRSAARGVRTRAKGPSACASISDTAACRGSVVDDSNLLLPHTTAIYGNISGAERKERERGGGGEERCARRSELFFSRGHGNRP